MQGPFTSLNTAAAAGRAARLETLSRGTQASFSLQLRGCARVCSLCLSLSLILSHISLSFISLLLFLFSCLSHIFLSVSDYCCVSKVGLYVCMYVCQTAVSVQKLCVCVCVSLSLQTCVGLCVGVQHNGERIRKIPHVRRFRVWSDSGSGQIQGLVRFRVWVDSGLGQLCQGYEPTLLHPNSVL